jgi:hypothetical protein
MSFRVNYDSIAAGFDRRYAVNDYSGVERALKAFVGPEFTGRVLEVVVAAHPKYSTCPFDCQRARRLNKGSSTRASRPNSLFCLMRNTSEASTGVPANINRQRPPI